MNSTMTPDEVRQARAKIGLTQYEMARTMGVSIRTYRRWERIAIPQTAALLLAKLTEEAA